VAAKPARHARQCQSDGLLLRNKLFSPDGIGQVLASGPECMKFHILIRIEVMSCCWFNSS
jgi:hypothetical protein